jgi:hypothetical protein
LGTSGTVDPNGGERHVFYPRVVRTDDQMNESDGAPGRRGKVARLLDEYDLESVGPELERRWTADGDDRASLRDLATYFNRRLLEAVLAASDAQPFAGEAATAHRLLTDDDASGAERTRVRRRLERAGVDVDALLDDFVSYQAVRTYLTSVRGAEYDPATRPRTAAEAENIGRLRGRTVSVTEEKLDRLRRDGHLSLGDLRVVVSITVLCEDCGARYDVAELLERGGCDCGDDPE